jgi:hypothetical protein
VKVQSALLDLSAWAEWKHDCYAFSVHRLCNNGQFYPFYGIDGTCFRLGPVWYEAQEDPSDGYRSYLGSLVPVAPARHLISPSEPVCWVQIVDLTAGEGYTQAKGFCMMDRDCHVWLRVGTDNSDDYYPFFVFQYDPPFRVLHDAYKRRQT